MKPFKFVSSDKESFIGTMWLHHHFAIQLPSPLTFVMKGDLCDQAKGYLNMKYDHVDEQDRIETHFKYAMLKEAFDLGIILAALKAYGRENVLNLIISEPAAIWTRRLWFIYEFFIEKIEEIKDSLQSCDYVFALDPQFFCTREAEYEHSIRHRVNNNIIGVRGMCPFVRRTKCISDFNCSAILEKMALLEKYDSSLFPRALMYSYTKDTQSSFELEGEKLTQMKEYKLAEILKNLDSLEIDEKGLCVIQNELMNDARFKDKGFRNFQNYVGSVQRNFKEKVHFICPKPSDLGILMASWFELYEHAVSSKTSYPLAVAAIVSFSFVFLHPFSDGNGRIHRLLMHKVLRDARIYPSRFVIPLSAAILKLRVDYDDVLSIFSSPRKAFTTYDFDKEGKMTVKNNTSVFFQYFDSTPQAEFLVRCFEYALEEELIPELKFLERFDKAMEELLKVADLPNRVLIQFVSSCMQNNGVLSKKKRKLPIFKNLTEDEIHLYEQVISRALSESKNIEISDDEFEDSK
jgi:hypothetical protein